MVGSSDKINPGSTTKNTFLQQSPIFSAQNIFKDFSDQTLLKELKKIIENNQITYKSVFNLTPLCVYCYLLFSTWNLLVFLYLLSKNKSLTQCFFT